MLTERPWGRVTLRHGTKGPLAAHFATIRVCVADGATCANNRHLPGEEVWLVGEWHSSGERKYYLSNLSPRIWTPLKTHPFQGVRAGPSFVRRLHIGMGAGPFGPLSSS